MEDERQSLTGTKVYVGKLGNAYFYRNTIAGQTDFFYGNSTQIALQKAPANSSRRLWDCLGSTLMDSNEILRWWGCRMEGNEHHFCEQVRRVYF